uniref:Uncharacterized protein n=1 Tax=Candidatus Kentrum sp. DK TaxID=2126562 RepID=A0A450TFR1_9GAMM|nr:MAG: hypothetical protein BECKDK2373C_GA0170839_11397 [Candidatus Kentron sp. DK]
MTEKTRQETHKAAAEPDAPLDDVEEAEEKMRDSFGGSSPPLSSPLPGAEPAVGKGAKRQPVRTRWLNLFFALLLILSWLLSTVGFYVLFSAWSIETPFDLGEIIKQVSDRIREPGIGPKIAFGAQVGLAMFFAALGAFLVGAMSRSAARLDLGPGRRLLSGLLLVVGLFISGMSGFVVIWSYNNHESLLKEHKEGIGNSFDIAIGQVRDHYAARFAGERKKILQDQDRQNRIENLSGRREGFRQEIEKYGKEFDRFSRLLRALEGNTANPAWILGRVKEIYGEERNRMLRHLLGEDGVERGFGRRTTEFMGAMAKDWARELHALCKGLSSVTGDLAGALGTDDPTSAPCVPTGKALEADFQRNSLFGNRKPNHPWLTGAFIEGLEDKFIGPLLRDVEERFSRFSSLAGKGKPQSGGAGGSSDRFQWATDFDNKFRARRDSIYAHVQKNPPKFTTAFEALKKLSTDLAGLLSEEPLSVTPPKPRRLHTVVREKFFAMWFGSAYYVPGRYLNEAHLKTNQSDSTTLFRAIEAVNEFTHFSREGFVTALEDQLRTGLSPSLRVQLLGVANCGRQCGRRIAALKKDHEVLAGNLEALHSKYPKYLATASAGDIEGKLMMETGVDLDNRERDLLSGVVREYTAKLNNEWFAYFLASLADLLAVAFGIFAVLSARGPAKWNKRLFGWLKRLFAWGVAQVPGTEARYRHEREQAERQARHQWEERDLELQKRWEGLQRFSREYFMDRFDAFDRKKKERWEETLKTGEGGIDVTVDTSLAQDLVLMATGIPGAEMDSLAEVAIKLGDIYKGIAESSGEMHKAFRDEMKTVHKTLVEMEVIREQYRNRKEEMKLTVSNLWTAHNQVELAAIHAKIYALKQSGEEARGEVERYVHQSLKNFQLLLKNIEHFDQTDFFQRLSEKERNTYKAFEDSLRESADELSNRVDEYLSASATGFSKNRDEGKGPNGDPDANA